MSDSKENQQTAFITGGSGYVGRNMIRYLIKKGWKVNALARSKKSALTVESLGAKSVFGDLFNIKAMSKGMKGCIVCFHCAAFVDTWAVFNDAMKINRDGTLNVIAACRDCKTIKKFIHVSTEQVLQTKNKPLININETTSYPLNVFGLYGKTKKEAEIVALKANISCKFEVISIRPRLIWGGDDTTILPNIITKCKYGLFPWIDGGNYKTSTVHINNVCEAMYLCYLKGKGGEIYFITDGNNNIVKWREFWSDMLFCCGVRPPPSNKIVSYKFIFNIAGILEYLFCCCKYCKCCNINKYIQPMVTQNEVEVGGKETTVDDTKIRKELGFKNVISRKQGFIQLAKQYNVEFNDIKKFLVTI